MKPASINTTCKPSPVCPYCAYVFQHPDRFRWPENSYVENDCPNCGKTFWAIRVVEASYSYTTRALGDTK